MSDISVQVIVLDSGLDMYKFFQIAKALQPHPQIMIGHRNIVEFNMEKKIPKPDIYLEAWSLSLRELKIFKISEQEIHNY
jgi:hypothetical protein